MGNTARKMIDYARYPFPEATLWLQSYTASLPAPDSRRKTKIENTQKAPINGKSWFYAKASQLSYDSDELNKFMTSCGFTLEKSHEMDSKNQFYIFKVIQGERALYVIVVRGSDEKKDWIENLDTKQVEFLHPKRKSSEDLGKVHENFYNRWKTIEDYFSNRQLEEQACVVCCGHSLGGAIATLGAVSLKFLFPLNRVEYYTIGAPKPGDERFAKTADSVTFEHSWRWRNDNDPIPILPAGPQWRQPGRLLTINDPNDWAFTGILDHKSENYIEELERLFPNSAERELICQGIVKL